MKKKFTDATVTMTLNDYNEMVERLTLLESAVTVCRPSWTKDYIEVRFDCQLVESFIMEKFFSLPYFEEYKLRDHALYAASTTIADLRKPEEEMPPTNEATEEDPLKDRLIKEGLSRETAPEEELSWDDPAAHVELDEELGHFIPYQHARPMGVTNIKGDDKNETI